MSINRHNYEEYFILYMDNELNSADRRIVESFVQNHPDLKDELDILLQSKLLPDNNIVFDNKEELMKIGDGSVINPINYEEWLTLYIDNELNPERRNQVERFIAAHSQVQDELKILQKTKLQPEEIVFPYKESLYRRTEKVRVIQMGWWRVAAAAILLLALSTTVIFVLNKKKQPGESFASSTLNDQLKQTIRNIATTSGKNNVTPKTEIKKDNKDIKPSNSVLPNLAKNNKLIKKKLPENKNDKKEEPVIANNDNNKPSNDLPQPKDNPNIKNETNYGIATTIESNSSPTNNRLVTKRLPNTSEDGLTFTNNQDNSSSDLQESGQNKSSRGFFRKAVRFIEKRTGIKPANDDDRVLIGSLAVKL